MKSTERPTNRQQLKAARSVPHAVPQQPQLRTRLSISAPGAQGSRSQLIAGHITSFRSLHKSQLSGAASRSTATWRSHKLLMRAH